jgi:hypothetical protein
MIRPFAVLAVATITLAQNIPLNDNNCMPLNAGPDRGQ